MLQTMGQLNACVGKHSQCSQGMNVHKHKRFLGNELASHHL